MRLPLLLALFAVPCLLSAQTTIPADTPLRIALDQQVRLAHIGEPVHAHLAAPIYLGEQLVFPEGTPIVGHVERLLSAGRLHRAGTIARGDFTPARVPDIRFDRILLADGSSLRINTAQATPSGEPLRMVSATSKQSRIAELKSTVRQRRDEAISTFKTESKLKRLEQRLVLSLPYHPQWIDAGARYDADLAAPLSVSLPQQPPAERSALTLPQNSTVRARFVNTISSLENHPGDPVTAVVTEPLFDGQHKLILPEGTLLHGEVQRAQPARWFGRGGKLRFRFNSVELPATYANAAPQHISGQLTAAEGASQSHLRIDPEGGTESAPAANRFLAPLTLGLLASKTIDEDGSGSGPAFLSGGFGFTGRLMAIGIRATPVSAGLGYYALSHSLYSRWIARGKNVIYPRDTRIEVSFGER